MFVTCPSCSSRYVVDPAKIGPNGRAVKCAKCGHTWAEPAPPSNARRERQEGNGTFNMAEAKSSSNDTLDAIKNGGGAFLEKSLQPIDSGGSRQLRSGERPVRQDLTVVRRKSNSWATLLAWLLLIAVVSGTLGGGIIFRDEITANWALAKRIFERIGYPSTPKKQRFRVQSVNYTYPSKDIIEVAGELRNLSSSKQDKPKLRVVFRDSVGRTVKIWTFPMQTGRMLPNEVAKFSTKIHNYPTESERIEIGLASE